MVTCGCANARVGRRTGRTAAAVAMLLLMGACANPRPSTSASPLPRAEATPPPAAPSTPTAAAAPQLHFVQHTSTHPLSATLTALRSAITKEGLTVVDEFDQPGTHVLLADNPAAGKLFYRANPAIGAELPVEIDVWTDRYGAALIGYFDPEDAVEAIDPNMADGCRALASTIDLIAQDATGDPGIEGAPAPARFTVSTTAKPFADAVRSLKSAIARAGLRVLGEVNQAAVMHPVGLDLSGAQALFITGPGTTAASTPAGPVLGVGLPVRVYVWVGHDHATHIGYFAPAAQEAAIGSDPGGDSRLTTLLADITRSTS